MKINTNTYFNSHGKNPRGFGHWMFEISGGRIEKMSPSFKSFFGNPLDDNHVVRSHTGTYTDAKQEMVRIASLLGGTAIKVLP
jgi:hypothetical protein